jgi:hypothetical protein
MPSYPGQQRRRWPAVLLAGLLAAAIGFGVGWAVFGRSGHAAAPQCPGGQDDAGRHRAAACLVSSYFALENVPPDQRDAALSDLIVRGAVATARSSYQSLQSKVSVEYAAVAATKLAPSPTNPITELNGQAWVAFVDSFKDNTSMAQWWIARFDLRWSGGRWLLEGGVLLDADATPTTTTPANRNGFGDGWVAVGRA